MNLDKYILYLDGQLSPARFLHSLGVMKVMEELAPIYQIDRQEAVLAGLVHDAGKELDQVHMEQLAQELGYKLQCPEDRDPLFLHGPASALIAQHMLGIDSPVILEAVYRHSYVGNSPARSAVFCWCLRFADILEPGRDWEDVHHRLKPLVYSGNLVDSALALMDWLIPFLLSAGIRPHPRQYLLRKELLQYIQEKHKAGTDPSVPV